jgi:hypothetical protein
VLLPTEPPVTSTSPLASTVAEGPVAAGTHEGVAPGDGGAPLGVGTAQVKDAGHVGAPAARVVGIGEPPPTFITWPGLNITAAELAP